MSPSARGSGLSSLATKPSTPSRRLSRAPPRARCVHTHKRALYASLLLALALCALSFSAARRASRGALDVRDEMRRDEMRRDEMRRDEMRRDYETRLQHATRRGRRSPQRRFLRWLHVPKTGTSLVNTLIRWGCVRIPPDTFVMPRKERPHDLTLSHQQTFSWDWLFSNRSGRAWLQTHCAGRLVTTDPLSNKPAYSLNIHKPLSRWELPHAVVMFRIPKQRTYSNYLHLSLHYNSSRTAKESIYSFTHRPEFWSQHTKLLIGRGYRDSRLITEKEALVAVSFVLNQLPFVGLTEQFRLSCRLFHAKFGGVPHLVQFENVRPSLDRYQQPQSRNEAFRYDETQFGDWVDSADEMVYAAAQHRFWNDVTQYKSEIEKDGLGPVHVTPPSERYQTHVLKGPPDSFRHIVPFSIDSNGLSNN